MTNNFADVGMVNRLRKIVFAAKGEASYREVHVDGQTGQKSLFLPHRCPEFPCKFRNINCKQQLPEKKELSMSFQLLFIHRPRPKLVLYFRNINSTHLIKILGDNWKCSNCDKIEEVLTTLWKLWRDGSPDSRSPLQTIPCAVQSIYPAI